MLINHILKRFVQFSRKAFLTKRIGRLGDNCIIGKYYCIEGKGLTIGKNVTIADGAWIKASSATGNNDVELKIEDGCNIGRFNEIYATQKIVLEKKVLTAERVYISDNLHGYSNPDVPIIDQPIVQKRTVTIGEGSWIGVGASIIGANIGKHCVVGANAVVTHDIPDYSIVVGIPAKIIKQYDFQLKKWVNI